MSTDYWQPIGTAPRDGAMIQLYDGSMVWVGYYSSKYEHLKYPWRIADPDCPGGYNGMQDNENGPRMWRPLADAPE
ncbi:MAG: hypothetical protein K9N22_03270 [Candidatus Marinimicrobia bacterium]|nr:hypothetical protein [Candidatus Neomarinimicrobiota bacterium]